MIELTKAEYDYLKALAKSATHFIAPKFKEKLEILIQTIEERTQNEK